MPELIAYISTGSTLELGDIIATARRPARVLGIKRLKWLEPGTRSSIEVTVIDGMVNMVAG